MPFTLSGVRSFALPLALVVASFGCAKKKTAPPPPQPVVNTDPIESRVATASTAAANLNQRVASLPGNSDDAHLQLVRESLSDIATALPPLYGPEVPGSVQRQIDSVADQVKRLQNLQSDVNPEPIIDTALRSATRALEAVAKRDLYAELQVEPALERLNLRIKQLDDADGPMHQLVTAQAIAQIGQILNAFSGELEKCAVPVADEMPTAEEPKEQAKPVPSEQPSPDMEKAPELIDDRNQQ